MWEMLKSEQNPWGIWNTGRRFLDWEVGKSSWPQIKEMEEIGFDSGYMEWVWHRYMGLISTFAMCI